MEALSDMADFDAKVYCVRSELEERVGEVPILPCVELIDWERAREIINEHDMVTTF
jgi:hypothetical protein